MRTNLTDLKSDPLMLRQYIMAERAHIDYLANLEAERAEGLAEGRAEGFNEAQTTIIRTIREDGSMTDEQIANLLKLPLDFIERA